MMANIAVVVPFASLAVQVTGVLPSGYEPPDAGEQLTGTGLPFAL
jgi:hypothetical protein